MKLFDGLCFTYAGVICQLVGLGWDIMMHRANPHTMGSEDILTLSNPSHLLIGFGLLLVGAGTLGQLMRNPVHLRTATIMSTVGCLALVLLSATGGGANIPLVGAMMASSHNHHSAAEQALPSGAVLTLQTVLREQGTSAALTKLEEMTVSDPSLLSQAHDVAHALGKYSFKHYGDAATAFSHCRETFQSGCYHGVMEAHFEANPTVDRVALGKLCSGGIMADQVLTLRFQCLHGLGHGLTFHFEHDLVKALAHCDYLPSTWDQGSCYGGAFMENAILFWQQRTGGSGAVHDHVKDHKPFVKAEDPLYPCTVLADRYLHECYQMQTSNVLTLNGYNFAEAFKVCDNAQARWKDVCYHSMGRDVSGYTLRDSAKSVELCMLGSPAHRAFCFQGAVRNFIHIDWKTDKAMPFCSSVPADGKDACFRAIGEELVFIHTDAVRRASECAKAEAPFVAVCTRGAQAG
jgi:hypothetical protein